MNRNMSITFTLAGLVLALGSAHAAPGGESLANGKSVYGSAVAAPQAARQVHIDQAKSLNVACGETVTFRKGDQVFSWKFDSANHRAVDLRALAPAGFADKPFMVYVSRNESERT